MKRHYVTLRTFGRRGHKIVRGEISPKKYKEFVKKYPDKVGLISLNRMPCAWQIESEVVDG